MAVLQPVTRISNSLLRSLFLLGFSFQLTVSATEMSCNYDGHDKTVNPMNTGITDTNCTDTTISCESFPTIEAAVLHALTRFNRCSIHHDTEFLGTILRNPDRGNGFIYSIGSGVHGENNISVRVKIPKGFKMVAFWHTHGRAHWSYAYFSATDTALADKWQLPMYLANYSGKVNVYEPGSPTISRLAARRLGLGNLGGYAMGSPVFNRIHY